MSKIRILAYGGAQPRGENRTFKYACDNVIKDYANDLPQKSFFVHSGFKQIFDFINKQADNSIQSLDIFCHGNSNGAYFHIGTFMDKTVKGTKQGNLYRNSIEKYRDILDREVVDRKDQTEVDEIDCKKFTSSCKIEIHGCNTATEDSGNLCMALSLHFFQQGNKRAVVIGHSNFSNPNINGEGNTKPTEQDYRHGTRRIYHNGKILATHKEKGRITASTINALLKKAGV